VACRWQYVQCFRADSRSSPTIRAIPPYDPSRVAIKERTDLYKVTTAIASMGRRPRTRALPNCMALNELPKRPARDARKHATLDDGSFCSTSSKTSCPPPGIVDPEGGGPLAAWRSAQRLKKIWADNQGGDQFWYGARHPHLGQGSHSYCFDGGGHLLSAWRTPMRCDALCNVWARLPALVMHRRRSRQTAPPGRRPFAPPGHHSCRWLSHAASSGCPSCG